VISSMVQTIDMVPSCGGQWAVGTQWAGCPPTGGKRVERTETGKRLS